MPTNSSNLFRVEIPDSIRTARYLELESPLSQDSTPRAISIDKSCGFEERIEGWRAEWQKDRGMWQDIEGVGEMV